MNVDVLVSGFGGQGALFAGKVLARAAMNLGHHVTWIPSYGPEMRGGKARCSVVISDDEIGSPLVSRPAAAIVLNLPSMEAFEPTVRKNGLLVVNSSLIPKRSERDDIHTIYIPASDMASEMGGVTLTNIICLGALIRASEILPLEAISEALGQQISERRAHLLDLNRKALIAGAGLTADET